MRTSPKSKHALLEQTARSLITAAVQGYLGRPMQVLKAETIAGPRAGAVRLYGGLHTGSLYRALAADDAALARQFIAWSFPGDVSVYLDGRAVRVEAPWPPGLATEAIRLRDIAPHPRGGGRWVIGIDEIGRTVIGSFGDRNPHWLVAGTTGSGKTTALLGAALQLARTGGARLVLIDGKAGAGLAPLTNLPGVIGPIAGDPITARRALGWVYRELQHRYETLAMGSVEMPYILVVVFDEFQEFTTDPLVAELLRRIVSRGRAARVHCLLATQHPTTRMFGDNGGVIKRNLPARLALRVLDAKASEVAVGGPVPRADRLTGAGDAYTITTQIHRVQVALVEREDFDRVPRSEPVLDAFPDVNAEDLGQEVEPPRWSYTGEELAAALVAAAKGWGRPSLQRMMERLGMNRPGSVRADRLLRLGREQHQALEAMGGRVVVEGAI